MPIRFQVDPDFYDHPKAIGMSDAATALWVRAGSYSAAKTSDGFVAEAALSLLSRTPMEAARELCRRGLWTRVKGGYRFHQWDHRNLTRARVEADKEADRKRKRRERQEAARQNGKPQASPPFVRPDSGPDSDRNPGGVHPLSVSVSVSESVSGSGRVASGPARASPEPPLRCPEHIDDRDPPACGRCKDARLAHDEWRADRDRRLDQAARCAKHAGELAHNCRACLGEAKGAR